MGFYARLIRDAVEKTIMSGKVRELQDVLLLILYMNTIEIRMQKLEIL